VGWCRERHLHSVALVVPHLTSRLLATDFGSPGGITTQDHQVLRLWHISWYFAAPLAVIVVGLIVWCMIAYRARPGAIPAQHQYHIPLEIAYTIIPFVIVAVLFGYMYQAENKIDKVSKNPAVHITVNGFQWGWRFVYDSVNINGQVKTPDFKVIGSVANEPDINDNVDLPIMVLPANEDVQFDLVSLDVIHSFYIPETLFKRDLIPGVKNVVDMTFKAPGGPYIGECTQFCGTYHPYMRFNVKVLSIPDFNNWVQQQTPGKSYYAGQSTGGLPGGSFGGGA
jgi:cytochrome c oxidase subunit 2